MQIPEEQEEGEREGGEEGGKEVVLGGGEGRGG